MSRRNAIRRPPYRAADLRLVQRGAGHDRRRRSGHADDRIPDHCAAIPPRAKRLAAAMMTVSLVIIATRPSDPSQISPAEG